MFEFRFADIGDGITEGKVLKWLVNLNDKVKEGDTLVIVETDKVNAELPSPVTGIIVKKNKQEGEIINVGEVIVVIDDQANVSKSDAKESENKKGASVIGEIEVSSAIIEASSEKTSVSKLDKKVLATPVARNYAKTVGIDINTISGSGPQGRVLKEDITLALKADKEKSEKPKVFTFDGDIKVEPITTIRKSIANAMHTSKSIIADTVLMDEIIVDKLVALRNEAKIIAAKKDISLTYMAFIAKASIIALKEFPLFNASFNHEKNEITYKSFINLGFAVDTKEGLIVPNIKNANNLSIYQLAQEISRLANLALNRNLKLQDIQNGSFTITNFGSFGISYGTPIINYPEVAILGIGRITKKAIVVEDQIKIGYVLPLSLAVDHRIIDGADAGRFLLKIKELLENPINILLI